MNKLARGAAAAALGCMMMVAGASANEHENGYSGACLEAAYVDQQSPDGGCKKIIYGAACNSASN